MNNKKALIALALVALVGIVGGTFAYYTSTSKLTNEFTTGTYSTSVTEEFISPDNWTPGTTTDKVVTVRNNGTVAIVARASFEEKWVAADGTTRLNGIRNNEKVAQFDINPDWIAATDGYYYYKDVLGQNATSTAFIEAVTFNPNFVLQESTFKDDGSIKVRGDITCTKTGTEGEGTTTINCVNEQTGYAGATYTLEITIETIQSDKAWTYTAATN